MDKYCVFTGVELSDESAPLVKKMCINCKSAIKNEDGTYSCVNDEVMGKGLAKVLAAVPEGFEIDTIKLKPMALKNPLKKCGEHEADYAMLTEALSEYFK
jgi:hypothetical protein